MPAPPQFAPARRCIARTLPSGSATRLPHPPADSPPTPIPEVRSNIECSCCLLHFKHCGLQPGQDTTFGDPDRPNRHPEFLGGVRGRSTDDTSLPERLPSGGLDFAPHSLGGTLKHRASHLLIELDRLRARVVGQLVQHRLKVRTAGRSLAPLALFQPIDDQVASHLAEPAPKRSSLLRRIPAVDVPANRHK